MRAGMTRLLLVVVLCCGVSSVQGQDIRFLSPGAPAKGATAETPAAPALDTPPAADTAPTLGAPTLGGADFALQDILRRGEELRRERRYGELVRHYQVAVEGQQGSQLLEERLVWARAHQDVARRHADRSFVQISTTLNERQAIDLYSEVLRMVESHYVDRPAWSVLVDRGTTTLRAALSDPLILKTLAPGAGPEQIDAYLRELAQLLGARPVQDPTTARAAAWYAGQLAHRRLGTNPVAVTLEYTAGATASLDPYSAFLTPDQFAEVQSQIDGSFVGLGVELESHPDHLRIMHVIPGGPADEAGLRSGDRIEGIDGKTVTALTPDAAANQLRGEPGTSLEINVARDGGSSQRLRIVRRVIEVPSVVDAQLVDEQAGIGYFRITSFQKTTMHDVDQAMRKLQHEGLRSLIIDLRGNPGGLLNASVDLADRFLREGEAIVSTRGRTESFDFRAHGYGIWRMPLVLLIDRDSASASEIFAGAISDNGRGTVVGERSYGKGSVQGIFSLHHANAGLRLTTSKFFSPSGRQISQNGVLPHVQVQVAARPADDQLSVESDPALQAAIRAAK